MLNSFISFTQVKINELVIESITNAIPTVQKTNKADNVEAEEVVEELPVIEEVHVKKGKKNKKTPDIIELDV